MSKEIVSNHFVTNLVQCSSVAQPSLTLCDPMNRSTAKPPCPSPTPGVYSNSCPLSRCVLYNNIKMKSSGKVERSAHTVKSTMETNFSN